MPYPEGGQLNPSGYNPLLTQLAMSYIPTFDDFIAPRVFPTVPVAAASGTFNVWTRGDFMRRGGKRLANYEAPPIEGFSSSSRNYSVDNWGAATMWTARDLAEARAGGTSDADYINAKVRFVTMRGQLEREIQTAQLVQTSANWAHTRAGLNTGGLTGTNFLQWDQAASTPVEDITDLKETFKLASGVRANTIIIPRKVVNKLTRNASLIDRIKYGGTMERPTEVTQQQIEGLFGFDNFLVPEGVYNTAAEGQEPVYNYIWNNTVWIGYVAPEGQRNNQTPSAGYNFAWTGDTTAGLPAGMAAGDGPQSWGMEREGSTEGLFIRRFRENRPSGEFCESELWITPNVVGADLGMTLTAPIAA